jgi:hypothetical protein
MLISSGFRMKYRPRRMLLAVDAGYNQPIGWETQDQCHRTCSRVFGSPLKTSSSIAPAIEIDPAT